MGYSEDLVFLICAVLASVLDEDYILTALLNYRELLPCMKLWCTNTFVVRTDGR